MVPKELLYRDHVLGSCISPNPPTRHNQGFRVVSMAQVLERLASEIKVRHAIPY